MRYLSQPATLKSSAWLALITTILVYPKLTSWHTSSHSIGYLLLMAWACSFFLWCFVMAWHKAYSSLNVFQKLDGKITALSIGIATCAAIALKLAFDPVLIRYLPEAYPTTVADWFGRTLFSIFFEQLFMVMAPFAFAVRLFKSNTSAFIFTLAFNICILLMRANMSSTPLPMPLLLTMILTRTLGMTLCLLAYMRGGVYNLWIVRLLLESRTLPL